MVLHVHIEMVMKKICERGNKSRLYVHMKMLIEKGYEINGSKLKLIDDDGETIDEERMLKAMIEKFWGDLFCMDGDATHGSKKEIVDGGMKNREEQVEENNKVNEGEQGSKRHSLQALELSQWFQAAVQIVSNLPAPSNGGPIYRFLSCRPRGPAGWLALLLTKAGDVETNPGPTTLNKKVWICDICHKQIPVRKQISIRCNRIEHWVHL